MKSKLNGVREIEYRARLYLLGVLKIALGVALGLVLFALAAPLLTG